MPVLTGIDILGIQKYVFASNRLRDVLSASWMVEHVANRHSLAQWGLAVDRVIAAAGGNAIVRFDGFDEARKWTAYYTRWLQETAPGLDAIVAHQSYDARPLAWGIKALQITLARRKLERIPGAPQLGLSVTASCSVTGLPATHLAQGDLVSPRVRCLREKIDLARQTWDRYLPHSLTNAPRWRVKFPPEFDRMGRSHGETSLLGVVHVDGNSVGKAIQAWLDRCIDEKLDNDAVWERFGEWSKAIDALGKAVLHAVVKRTAECAFPGKNNQGNECCLLQGTPDELGFRLHDWRDDKTRRTQHDTAFLPFQPILLGGDDLTFVCDGRIALDLAAAALREYERHEIPHLSDRGGKILTACAGVALVKVRAPFHRSYEVAEDLCQSAKRIRQEINQEGEVEAGSWLDWHAGTTRPGESVDEIRERQYKRNSITMRPYPLVNSRSRHASWDWLDKELLGPGSVANDSFRGFREERSADGRNRIEFNSWSSSRNRVKRLGSLVSNGKDEVERQINAWKVTEPRLRMPAGLLEGGFIGSETPLLDAIELMDLHLRLEPHPRQPGPGATAETDGVTSTDAKKVG